MAPSPPPPSSPSDEYTTLCDKPGAGIVTERRSRFLAFAHHVTTPDEAKALVAAYRKKYYDARHVCFAYVIGPTGDTYRTNDDGEPSGTAGRPIIGQIRSAALTDTLVVVVRYFGGVKLGTSGLAEAYRSAAHAAIADAGTVTRVVTRPVTVTLPYTAMNGVMRAAKDMSAQVISQTYGTHGECRLTLRVRASAASRLRGLLSRLPGVTDVTDNVTHDPNNVTHDPDDPYNATNAPNNITNAPNDGTKDPNE